MKSLEKFKLLDPIAPTTSWREYFGQFNKMFLSPFEYLHAVFYDPSWKMLPTNFQSLKLQHLNVCIISDLIIN